MSKQQGARRARTHGIGLWAVAAALVWTQAGSQAPSPLRAAHPVPTVSKPVPIKLAAVTGGRQNVPASDDGGGVTGSSARPGGGGGPDNRMVVPIHGGDPNGIDGVGGGSPSPAASPNREGGGGGGMINPFIRVIPGDQEVLPIDRPTGSPSGPSQRPR